MTKLALRRNDILILLFDLLLVSMGVLLGRSLLPALHDSSLPSVTSYAVLLALGTTALIAWLGLYQHSHNRSLPHTTARALLLLLLSLPTAHLLLHALPINAEERPWLLAAGLSAILIVCLTRIYIAHNPPGAWLRYRVMIFGVGEEAAKVASSLKEADPSVRLVGYYPSASQETLCVPHDQLLSRERSLLETANALHIDEIIVAVSERRGGTMPLRELLECRLAGTRIRDLSSHFESRLGQIHLDALRAGWLIFGDGFSQGWLRRTSKRLIDYLAALTLLILAAPVMFITAVLIVLEDGFQVFYRQERVGLNGRLFHVIKFRSMRHDAEKDGKPRWASANDDRVTRVGRFIRKFRIDELPQLFCVLKGDMSLVGPRPERPYFVDQLTKQIPFYAVRHSVKPGVTGWAQVRYAYGASVDDAVQKLQYDLFYVKNNNLLLDFVVLFETVSVVLSGKGAQ